MKTHNLLAKDILIEKLVVLNGAELPPLECFEIGEFLVAIKDWVALQALVRPEMLNVINILENTVQ